MAPVAHAVSVSLEELVSGTVSLDSLREAFGPDSLGILLVKDVPLEYVTLRHRLLSYSSYLANLPESELAKLENEQAKYLTGWSRGKETLKKGQVDMRKGSFYANCAFYDDASLSCARPTAQFNAENFPEYLSPNIWPDEGTLAGFRETMERLCRLVLDVAVLVARACDRFAEGDIEGYPAGYLEKVVSTSTTTKARLLHYFPADAGTDSSAASESTDEDDWCATHLDHGCLTALTSAQFVDESDAVPRAMHATDGDGPFLSPLPELDASPDPAAGLYIKSRAGETVQVRIPRDCLAFQTGETLERITEGRFCAVPHFVRGARAVDGRRIARNTLAVFTQPDLGEVVDRREGITFGEFARGVVAKHTVKP